MSRRMIRMVKKGVVAIFVTVLLLSAMIFYLVNHLTDSSATIEQFNLRKEDLYSSQLRIEQSLAALNQTLQTEVAYRQSLIAQMVTLYQMANVPVPVMNFTAPAQTPVVPVTPTPAPRTRAS